MIDPTNLSADDAKTLGEYLQAHHPDVVAAANQPLSCGLELKYRLIKDKENKSADHIRYFVIDENKHGLLGFKGGSSKAIQALGFIDINLESKVACFTSDDSKALRIKNTSYMEKKARATKNKYKHKLALNNYQKALHFPYLGIQEPTKISHLSKKLGLFKQSYSLMNRLPSQILYDEVLNLINVMGTDTASLIRFIILPLLKAYKAQIADVNFVHRDIKFENILIEIMNAQTKIYFIDVDDAHELTPENGTKKAEKIYDICGTPGYIDPTLLKNSKPSAANDIFALGMLLTACINLNLEINQYLEKQQNPKTPAEFAQAAVLLINKYGSYDVDQLPKNITEHYDLFEYMDDPDTEAVKQARIAIKNLLKSMTSADPTMRPTIEAVIDQIEQILLLLQPQALNVSQLKII